MDRTARASVSVHTDKGVYNRSNYLLIIHSTWTSSHNYFNIPLYSTVKLNKLRINHEIWHLTTAYFLWLILSPFVKKYDSYCTARAGPTRGAFYHLGRTAKSSLNHQYNLLLHCQYLLLTYVLPVASGVCNHWQTGVCKRYDRNWEEFRLKRGLVLHWRFVTDVWVKRIYLLDMYSTWSWWIQFSKPL